MSKKNKDIEVRIEETIKPIHGKDYTVNQLFIGKKMIGEIMTMGPKEFQSFLGDEDLGASRSLETAIETVIRQWNLHD
ncbi:hypothetical protein A5886_002397 [Enterococcus sp. 8G7_MSG3316]|uniref:DUF2969 domain-containing protein n=1 Tax=Candidatus Enterococcus testudinis TaxID=1834191 RepID=A0A242A8D8_9ENTE|nr:DUF2969 domain-containing protein [Enterococcus sp. 8G7_MSG3316]OTN77298.1 hypothetical protein A5886_002397 [Enterococcus sp. 8G7_MSG3316]